MYTKSLFAACLALTATAAPTPQQPGLLKALSPEVVALLSGLGLPNVAVPVGGILDDASDGLKKRQDGSVPEFLAKLAGEDGEVPQLLEGLLGSGSVEKRQLLKDISPEVAALVSGLGLPNVGVPLGGVVNDLSDGLKKRQLLKDISPEVVALLSGLGLPNVAVPVGGVLNDASDGLKKRQETGAVPDLLKELLGEGGSLPQLLEGLLGSAPAVQKRQLLQDVSPDVGALLAGLGLISLAAPVSGIVNDLSNGL